MITRSIQHDDRLSALSLQRNTKTMTSVRFKPTHFLHAFVSFILFFISVAISGKPNLIIIQTDEQNFRTLGCYRKQYFDKNKPEQAEVWGENVKVETPYIDSLAENGAIYTSAYAAIPICTPSRSTFFTGKYPTDTWSNSASFSENTRTFATVMAENGYRTAYFGKWHLDGVSKPGWARDNVGRRGFGFNNNKYRYNRGHWKFILENDKGDGKVNAYTWKDKYDDEGDLWYTSDFLFDRAIDFIKKKRKKKQSFAITLALPDPHAPYQVRSPYDTMFDDMEFNVPRTAIAAVQHSPSLPKWAQNGVPSVNSTYTTDTYREQMKNDEKRQRHLRNIFGMLRLVDDNVGKLLRYLKSSGLEDNTIVVFTSDHGGMMSEHGRNHKGNPLEASAGIPFIVQYPKKIRRGKVVETSFTTVDFAPTILGLMGINHRELYQGIDGSSELLSRDRVNSKSQLRFISSSDGNKNNKWAAAVGKRFKLVLSAIDVPWLFDLETDPNELVNFYNDDDYFMVRTELLKGLLDAMMEYNFPLVFHKKIIQLSFPVCRDSPDQFEVVEGQTTEFQRCSDYSLENINNITQMRRRDECMRRNTIVSNSCPVTCESCCEDSKGLIWMENNEIHNCTSLLEQGGHCAKKKVKEFCPASCNVCNDYSSPL